SSGITSRISSFSSGSVISLSGTCGQESSSESIVTKCRHHIRPDRIQGSVNLNPARTVLPALPGLNGFFEHGRDTVPPRHLAKLKIFALERARLQHGLAWCPHVPLEHLRTST